MSKDRPTNDDEKRVIPVTDEADEAVEPAGPEPAGDAEAPAEDDPVDGEAPETLDGLRQQRDDLLARLQRLSADYLNYQKRTARDAEQARQYANAELAKAILGVLDDLERVIEHAQGRTDEDDPLLSGAELVYQKALEVLKGFGVRQIETDGPFDPEVHEAILRQPTDEVEPMTVLNTAQKGYRMAERTLRPARVVVAVAPENEAEDAGDDADEQ